MTVNSPTAAQPIEAALTFLLPAAEKPRVLMPANHADRIERTGAYHAVPVAVHDARGLSEPPTLDREGFALVGHPTAVVNFFDPAVVRRLYYPEVIDLLRRATGAKEVHVFDHTVRMEDGTTQEGLFARQPVALVHNDYTECSAIQRVKDCFPPDKAARVLARRFAFVNVWRSIGASAERFPLAAADGRSIQPGDYVPVDLVYSDRMGEVYHNAYSSGQRWFYFSGMRTDEAMLLKCFDSAPDGRTRYTAHTGFANPHAAPGTPPRRSIEVRSILFFDAPL
ncbi:MAG: hypothetical protein K0Q43_3029 [Ramlibacter sp.]|jgi:hypothetical protein|nr:hypothetical protein [Ramlibacter sp.]